MATTVGLVSGAHFHYASVPPNKIFLPTPTPAPIIETQHPAQTRSGGASISACSLAYIAKHESGNNPTAQNRTSTASGKFQYLKSTWNGYGGYSTAKEAPESVQDARASADLAAGKAKQWSVC